MLAVKIELTCLAEQILQILPSYSVGKLEFKVNKLPTTSLQRKLKETNVGDIDLAASSSTTAGTHATSESTSETATSGTTFVTTSATSRWASKSGFCLTILYRKVSIAVEFAVD
jgi:hypothetical protein